MLGIIINNATEAAEMLRGFSRALELKGRMSPFVQWGAWKGKVVLCGIRGGEAVSAQAV